MKVSVEIITYNHEKFIAQAIDSVLMQRVNFDYEIVIGDDYSTDNTRNILADYKQRHPDLINLQLNEKNYGGTRNAMNTYNMCRGEYVATLEGDDYWTDPMKLQIQTDLLDAHRDVVMCFHNAEVIYEDGTGIESHLNNVDQKETIGLDDLIGETDLFFIATASIMHRRAALAPPEWMANSKSGDIPLWILLAKQGKIKYIDRAMSVWRRQPKGQSYTDDYRDEWFIRNRIYMYSCINRELDFRYNKKISRNLARFYLMLPNCRQNEGKYLKSAYYALKAALMAPPRNYLEMKNIARYITPKPLVWLYSVLKSLLKCNSRASVSSSEQKSEA